MRRYLGDDRAVQRGEDLVHALDQVAQSDAHRLQGLKRRGENGQMLCAHEVEPKRRKTGVELNTLPRSSTVLFNILNVDTNVDE